MRSLLDVNVLIALLDADHVFHNQAKSWLRDNIASGWATCPITQNGCVRIMAQPGYSNSLPAVDIADRLRGAVATEHHQFWADDVSLLEPGRADWNQAISAKQLTDVYLLSLSVHYGGRFVTFDRRIAHSMVPGANHRHLCVI